MKDRRFGTIKRMKKVESVEATIEQLNKELEYYSNKLNEYYYYNSKEQYENYKVVHMETSDLLSLAYKRLAVLRLMEDKQQ